LQGGRDGELQSVQRHCTIPRPINDCNAACPYRHRELLSAAIQEFVASPLYAQGRAEVIGPAQALQRLLEGAASAEGNEVRAN